jgi:hypothetical protein
MIKRSLLLCHLLDHPGQRRTQVLPDHRSTGFADCRQPLQSPFTRTALPQLAHQQTVRQHDQVHVPGLALEITQLTVAEAELLLAVPVKGLRPRPAMVVDSHDSTHLPGDPIGHQNLARFFIILVSPDDHNPNLVVHFGDSHGHGKVPLPLVADPHLLAVASRDRGRQVVGLDDLPLEFQLAVELQVTDITSRTPRLVFFLVNVIEDLGVGEVRVKGEVAGDLPFADPVDQLAAQLGVIAERFLQGLADLLLTEEAELQGIMLAAGADVIGEEIVLGDLVAFFSVVPEPAGIGDHQAVAIDQRVVDGDDALGAVASRGVFLEFVEPSLVEFVDVPGGLGEEPIEAGLVGGVGELLVDAEHGFSLGDHEAGKVFGEVPPLALVGEEITVLGQSVLNDLGKLDDSWHEQMLRTPIAPDENWPKLPPDLLFLQS